MSREILEAMERAGAREGHRAREAAGARSRTPCCRRTRSSPARRSTPRSILDPETGDYRVIELIVPERLEAHMIVETIDENTYLDAETGEYVEPEEIEIDQEKFEEYADEIEEQDVTPDDFGRIAAQTAKQVILQRVREAERDMMFEEYRDRVGELVTGIVQQKDARYTLIQLRERVEALLPKSEQVDGERYEHNQRVKAVIKEVSASTKGPSIIVSRRDPELIKALFELEVPRSPTASWRSRTSPASRATARRSRSSRTPTASTRSAPASARAARACAWSSPSCAARRSTSSLTTTSPPASSPRRCRRRACARSSSTTPTARPR